MCKFIRIYKFNHGPSDYVVTHNHKCIELVYYKDGCGRTNIGNEIFEYNNDTIALLLPQTMHDEYASRTTEVICLQFTADFSLFESLAISKNDKNSQVMEKIYEHLEILYDFSIYKTQSTDVDYDREINFIIFLLMNLFEIKHKNRKQINSQLVDGVKKYMQSNVSRKIDFDILASDFGYSSNRLRVIFLEYTGVTVYQYLSGLRLSKAKVMLKTGNKSIEAIAKECGFGSKIRFTLFFKEKMNTSPMKYAKAVKDIECDDEGFNFLENQKIFYG